MEGQRERRVRSDKKKDIKSTVPLHLKDSLYTLAFIMKKPVKDVCSDLIVNGLFTNRSIIEKLSVNFQRKIHLNNVLYNGNIQNTKIERTISGASERVSFRLKREVYEVLYALAYALDLPISRTASVLLYESITDTDFMDSYIKGYVDSLDKTRRKELKDLLKYTQQESQKEYTFSDLLVTLVEEPITWTFPK